MNDAAAKRIQDFRDRAAEHFRLRSATKVKHFMDSHQSSAEQWMRLAEDAERVEKAYPNRRINRAAERGNGAS